MKERLEDHSFGLVLLLLGSVSLIWSLATGAEAKDISGNVFGDTYGAMLVVILSKWFRERGSQESK